MDELINAMSDEELVAIKIKHEGNESITTLVDGILATRQKQVEEALAKAKFTKGITKVFDSLPHPEDIHNVYASWREVEVEVEDGQPEEVDITQPDGSITEEMRLPKVKVNQWVVEVNKGFAVRANANGQTTSKRTITVYKHNASGADEELGVYSSYADFAKSKGVVVGSDSARRAVEREGYYGVFVS